jgi:transcriptional regulator with XRE-family HTH domain
LSRSQAGLAQRELAEAIGITFQQLQKYEKGVDRISASKLYAAARVLRRSMNWFFEDADLVAADNGDLARLINDFLAKPEAFELASTFRGLPLEKQKIVVRLIGSFAIPTTGRGAD